MRERGLGNFMAAWFSMTAKSWLLGALIPALLIFVPGPIHAVKAGALPLRPGETLPQPRQRGLDEIEAIPTVDLPCPVCGYSVSIPEVDKLMRRAPGENVAATKWRMHAERRDADLCPYPGKGKIQYQADIVVCPSCGFAQEAKVWDEPLPDEAKEWVLSNLQPIMREAEARLLGARGRELSEREVTAFFNRQEEIPDTVRTEHFRTYLQAVHAPALERARATWLAAWAARREVAGQPRSEVFARHSGEIDRARQAAAQRASGLHAELEALCTHLQRARQGKIGPAGAYDMTGRLALAGMLDRLGFLDEGELLLTELYQECRERYLRPDQDPLWPATTTRASRTHRVNELETLRTNAEAEVLVRVGLIRRERELLHAAAQCLRDALRTGELDGRPDDALFHAYLTGEFLRRADSLSLALEWFKVVRGLVPADSPLALAAAVQMEIVGEEAGDRINLLTAIGQDGDLFERLRKICGAAGR